MKKGFTLIELLAVIVILAIIAVIAVPIVIDIIEDTKINSIKSSASMYLKATELYISNSDLNKVKINPGAYHITKDGNICIGIIEENKCTGEIIKIEIKGNKPNSGKIIINENNIQLDYLEIDGYKYYEYNNEYIVEKIPLESVESNYGIVTFDSNATINLSNYKIYGNSIENESMSIRVANDLPKQYQQVEYIESTGTQYIDTRVFPNQNTGVEIIFLTKNKMSNVADEYGTVFGARTSARVNEFHLSSVDESGQMRFGTASNKAALESNKKIDLVLKNKLYINNSNINDRNHRITFSDEFQSPVSLTLFALNNNGTVKQHGMVQIYKLKIYDGDTLVRDYIPCYEKTSGEIGLYDLVGKSFYPNLGDKTYNFKIGNNVTEDLIATNSVGDLVEDENNPNFGKYEISIRVTGKNLFDEEYLKNRSNYVNIYGGGYSTAKVKLKPNTTYTIEPYLREGLEDPTSGFNFKVSDAYKAAANAPNIGSYNITKLKYYYGKQQITTGDDGLIYFHSSGSASATSINYIFTYFYFQLIEGTETIEYEPYKEEKYSIYLDEPLRCVNNVCDYIDYKKGKIVRNVTLDSNGNLIKLEKSNIQNIYLPKIRINKGVSNIFIDTNVNPSRFVAEL